MLQPGDVNSRTLPKQVLVYGKPYDLAGQEEMEYLLGTESGGEEGTVTVEVSSSDCTERTSFKRSVSDLLQIIPARYTG